MKKIMITLLIAVSFSAYINGQSSVKIGRQEWTSTNLNVTTYINGDKIPEVKDPREWAKLTTGAWCYYDNDPENGKKYGKLYNWYAVIDPRGLAPKGWHIPTDEEWTTLITTLGGKSDAGGKMKATGTDNWKTPNNGASNSSGFAGLPGGSRFSFGSFINAGLNGYWWSASECAIPAAWIRSLGYNHANANSYNALKTSGFSVRCVRD